MTKPSKRRYVIEFGAALLAYAVAVLITVPIIQANPDAAWRVPVALIPLVPSTLALVAVLRFVRSLDEFQQRIQLEGLAFAFLDTMLITLAYGFLENVGLPRPSFIWVAPLMIVLWGFGVGIAAWRYRA